ncbi:MAG: LD-carboxypeptidase [Fluviicola sp.]|nr:LD-carboxypeptidase [Fluviicola sp.]
MTKISRRSFIPILGTAVVGASCLSIQEPSEFLTENGKILPTLLKKGDTIGVSAPAGGIKNKSELDDFKKILEQLGFKVKFSKNCSKKHGYFSGTDEERASDFMDLILDTEINGIFFLRGGWGCARILPLLDFDAIKSNPKVIMGFSDITSLLNAITSKTGLVTFHGPGGNSTWNIYSVDYIKELLIKGELVHYSNLKTDLKITSYVSGVASGELFGGNLSVICSTIGTGYLPNWTGKILFLEDVGEEPYRIDRMLTQLEQSGVFKNVNGIILGVFRKCIAEEPERSFTLEEVFEQHFSALKIPVFYGAQIGHVRNKFTVPLGAEVEMNADEGSFRMLEAAVL